ncbi:MAG: hypothetical protein ACXWDO_02980, partial [Bacteroidia bacterium]
MSERSFITEVVGQNAEGIFVLRKSYRQPERNVTLEHYTKDMRLLHNKSYATDKGEYFVQVVLLSNEIQLYYTATDFNTREMEMRVRKLNFNLVAQGKDSVLFRMPGSDFSERKLRVYKPMGQQQSFFLFTKQSIDIPTSYHFYITDTTLHTLHAGEINLNISNKYEIENVAFTKSHIALLVREDVKRKVNKHGFMYYLAETKIGSASTILNPLFNDSINVTEGLIKADYTKNAIVFAGLFNMKDSSYAKGYYVRTHLPDSGKTITKMAVFPDGAIADLSGKNAKVKGIYNLRSGDMILRKDGGVVLTSEEYEETREAVMDMNMYGVSQTNFRYYFYYENMLVLSINPEGELDWYTVLRKEQVSVNDNGIYSSYSVSAQADKLVYIYNDLSRKSWNLSLYEVNADGESNNKIILRAQDYEAKLVPQYARQIAYDEVIIPGLSTKGYILLKVKL